MVDQFGYRPADTKVAVIHQPFATAQDSPDQYQHLQDSYQVVDPALGLTVYEAPAQIWQAGKIHAQSGDRAAWFDFSTVQKAGTYVVQNQRTGERSVPFDIADTVYQDVLRTATRMFFYQRSGFAKQPPYADPRWTDNAAFLGPRQDTEARFVGDKENSALERDLRGGWFDAGDTNKYVTFAADAIHPLLRAYTQNPNIWTDNFNIPESNNGLPDLVDEIIYELSWLERMQDDDGGVFIKMGTLDFNSAKKPSRDRRPRFYGPKCSSSTIALASMFAHAAIAFQDVPGLQALSANLQQKALMSWDWFMNHSMQTECDTREIKSGDADRTEADQVGLAITAAAYLSNLFPQEQFHTFIRQQALSTRPFNDDVGALYESYVVDALMAYTQFTTTPAELGHTLRQKLMSNLQQHPDLYGPISNEDPFRAFMPDDQYHWGSNAVKSHLGNANLTMRQLALTAQSTEAFTERALAVLHYLHGVNPLGIVYLTNMYEDGAEFSANEMWHEWFGGGIYDNARTSPSGPAPGYLVGGANQNYTGPADIAHLPPMRAFMDSNESDLSMWEISEPSIVYQGAYIKLLSQFIRESS